MSTYISCHASFSRFGSATSFVGTHSHHKTFIVKTKFRDKQEQVENLDEKVATLIENHIKKPRVRNDIRDLTERQ
jgi:hypothetical protein